MTIIDKRGRIISLWEKARRGKGGYVFLKWILIFCSSIFAFGLALRRFVYRCNLKKKARLKAKVISVGNITLGGTGKTPLVEYIARRIKDNKRKAAILSRGYGRKSMKDVGDEMGLLLRKIKDVSILVGKERVSLGKEAVNRLGAEVILLDDGFQHWAIARDLDVVTLDSTLPIWENRLFPAGTLREKVNNLKRAQIFVLTRVVSDSGPGINLWLEYLKNINPQAYVFLARHKPEGFTDRKGERFPLSIIKDKEIVAFSGIARPEAFEEALKELGGRLLYSVRYPDHYRYRAGDLERIEKIAQGVPHIITTEKDLVRIKSVLLDRQLLALVVEIEFLKNGDKFLDKIL